MKKIIQFITDVGIPVELIWTVIVLAIILFMIWLLFKPEDKWDVEHTISLEDYEKELNKITEVDKEKLNIIPLDDEKEDIVDEKTEIEEKKL